MDGMKQNIGIIVAVHDNTKSTEFGNYTGKDFARMKAKDRRQYMSKAWEKVLGAAHSPNSTILQAGDLILFNTAHIHIAPSSETLRTTLFLCLKILLPEYSDVISKANFKRLFGIPESLEVRDDFRKYVEQIITATQSITHSHQQFHLFTSDQFKQTQFGTHACTYTCMSVTIHTHPHTHTRTHTNAYTHAIHSDKFSHMLAGGGA